jgi:predicted O-methyltransferase YrrM
MLTMATHQNFLVRAALCSHGDIAELGCGWYSTPILHAIAEAQGRQLHTFESNQEWLREFRSLYEEVYHQFSWVRDWKKMHFRNFGMIFVDLSPGDMRQPVLDMLLDQNPQAIVVVHDVQEKSYGWDFSRWNHVCRDVTHPTQTIAVSQREFKL